MSLLTAWAGREVSAAKRIEAVRMRMEYERAIYVELLKGPMGGLLHNKNTGRIEKKKGHEAESALVRRKAASRLASWGEMRDAARSGAG
jgi:hypothetical protein